MSEVTIRPNQRFAPNSLPTMNNMQEKKESFGDVLNNIVGEINNLQVNADKAIAKVELDDNASIHDAIIALEKASISFRAMMQVRNKVIDAYQEIMRMQV